MSDFIVSETSRAKMATFLTGLHNFVTKINRKDRKAEASAGEVGEAGY
jgi:hypothetical protein